MAELPPEHGQRGQTFPTLFWLPLGSFPSSKLPSEPRSWPKGSKSKPSLSRKTTKDNITNGQKEHNSGCKTQTLLIHYVGCKSAQSRCSSPYNILQTNIYITPLVYISLLAYYLKISNCYVICNTMLYSLRATSVVERLVRAKQISSNNPGQMVGTWGVDSLTRSCQRTALWYRSHV